MDDRIPNAKEHPVDGFKYQAGIVNILNFNQSIPGRVVHTDLVFYLFPDGLGSGKRVVAIANRKKEDRLIRI
jgi:hypothetical protein